MKLRTRATKPSERTVKEALRELRRFIDENVQTNPVEARVAYIWESAIRWVTEETTWPKPLAHIETDTEIVRRDAATRTGDDA